MEITGKYSMRFSTFDTEKISKKTQSEARAQLNLYSSQIEKVLNTHNHRKPEYSLAHASDGKLHTVLDEVQRFKKVRHLVLVGIGGSSLGVEAVHTALGEKGVVLSVLDTIAPYEIDILEKRLSVYKNIQDVAICVVSKSGGTAETVVNAGVLFDLLQKKFGKEIYSQTIYIGNESSHLQKFFKSKKSYCVTMPEKVGGRFSVATEASLVPLSILGHDVDAYIAGFLSANEPELRVVAEDGAVLLHQYLIKGYSHLNLFMFDKRLYQVAACIGNYL